MGPGQTSQAWYFYSPECRKQKGGILHGFINLMSLNKRGLQVPSNKKVGKKQE